MRETVMYDKLYPYFLKDAPPIKESSMNNNPMGTSNPFAVVVNDDPTQLNVLSGLVRKAGLEPRVFTAAEDALAEMCSCGETANSALGTLPALVVTDLYMPGIDGWRFCRLLRSPEYAAFNHVPILVVSATFAGDEADRIAADLGAEAFLPSPVDGQRFMEQVQAILSGNQLRTPLRVLIVEDSKTQSGIISKAFAAHGYQADSAFTVMEAFAAFGKTAYDVAVLDYHLPDGKGDALLDAFSTQRPDCVCLMMTTDPGPELALEWMKRGAAAYLRKPFQTDYLIELCDRARRERALLRVKDLLEERTQELRKSEERFRTIAENAFDLVALLDERGHYIYCNSTHKEILGYSPEELVGRSCFDLVHPDDREDAERLFETCLAAKKPSEILLLRLLLRDGRTLLVEQQARLLADDEGALRILLNSRDVTKQKRAETQLNLALKIANIGYWDYECATDRVEWFSGHEDLFGISMQEFGGTLDAVQHCIHPEDRASSLLNLSKTLEENAPYDNTYRVIHPNGDIRWLHSYGHLSLDANGNQVHIFGITQDITDWKKAEEELIRQSDFTRRIFNSSEDHLAVVDVDGRILDTNDAWRRFAHQNNAGDERTWGPGANYFRQCSSAAGDISSAHDAFEGIRRVQDGRLPSFEMEYHCHSPAEQRWFIMRILPFIGRPGTVLISHVNVTARKLAEDALRESDERFTLAFNSAPIIITISSLEDGSYLHVNQRFVDISGFNRDEAIGKSSVELGWTSRYDQEQLLENILRYGKVNEIELSQHTKSGKTLLCKLWGEVITVAGHKRLLSIALDVTEHRKVEQQFLQAQKMESVGRLAGGVAHDFNNMLCVILGHAEIALDKVDHTHRLFTDLQEIRKAAERAAVLTRQLLAFARKQTVSPKLLDLNETVEGLLKMLLRLIGEDIQLSWQPAANLGQVMVDPSQIDQILVNLCVNARDAISGIGKIIIETGNIALDEEYCAHHDGFVAGEYVRLAVSDDGCGMDKDTLAHIFEPFFTTKGIGEGTGLGLATVYGIVKQNKGFINVYSEVNSGTIFTIYLPRNQGMAEQKRKEGPAEAVSRGNETILLVEDDPPILEVTTIMLQKQGYTVLAASTPGKAISLAGEHLNEIHLLMTDVIMPEMNGRDMARELLSIYPQLKCLFMSGYTADVIAPHGVLEDGVHFIQKPFSLQALAAKVREVMDSK